MSPAGSAALHTLLRDVQQRLETLYDLPAQPSVNDFLIPEEAADALPGGGSRTLVNCGRDGLALGVVLDSGVTAALAQADPRTHLSRLNLGPFCTLIEEVSHFVLLLFCARTERSATQLELELQAEVDKYLNVLFLLSLQNEGAVSVRLKELLFRRYRLRHDVTAEGAVRYRSASDLAYRYCGFLEERFLRRARLVELTREARRFYRLGQGGKLARIRAMGAV